MTTASQKRAPYSSEEGISVYVLKDGILNTDTGSDLPLSERIRLPGGCEPDRCKFADQGTLCSICSMVSDIRALEDRIKTLELMVAEEGTTSCWMWDGERQEWVKIGDPLSPEDQLAMSAWDEDMRADLIHKWQDYPDEE